MSADLALQARNIVVRFGHCTANDGASLNVRRGTIHALLGENGAGKSTLCKVLFGLVTPNSGDVRLDGNVVHFRNPREAMAAGLGMVHQHFMLVHSLTVAENVALGAEPSRHGLFDARSAADEVRALSTRFGLEVDPDALVADLPVGVQQRVEILKALRSGARTLILDEPTAVLTPQEVERLFTVLRALRDEGRTILIVTHKLDEVRQLCDAITVLRAGRTVAEQEAPLGTVESISALMVGRVVDLARRPRTTSMGEPRLVVENISVLGADGRPRVQDVSLTVRAGEIVGIAGVEGNGQTALAHALSGVLTTSNGRILLLGEDVTHASVKDRRQRGLAHVPEDRLNEGLAAGLRMDENAVLGAHGAAPFARMGLLQPANILERCRQIITRLDVRPPDPAVPAISLSGGNQQKVLVGRELAFAPKVLVLAQPTRGVDVGAIERIHGELLRARDEGAAILLFSAELSELMALSDVIHVMYRGRLVHSVEGAVATPEHLGPAMLGGA